MLLNTYAQNNGWTAESMAKRRRWDAELRSFLTGESEVRRATHPDGRVKPLVWTGDLNACHREVDVTHPSFFLNQKPEGKKGGAPPPQPEDPDDRGQPGFTVGSDEGSTTSSSPPSSSTRTDSSTATRRGA